MITVTYYREHCRVRIEGHAGYAPEGQDIVCASVSALAYTLAANAQRLVAIGAAGDLVCTLEKGTGEIGITPKRRYRDSVEMVFRAVCAGFEMLAQSYPDYIRYEIHG